LENNFTSFGDYILKERIFEGRVTQTFRCVSSLDGKKYVLKLIKSSFPGPDEISLLIHENSLAGNENIAGIIHSYGIVRHNKKMGLLLEDIDGIPLSEFLGGKSFTMEKFLPVAISITRALENLHENGIIHKDIKPQNIIVKKDLSEIRLTDLGIASALSQENLTMMKPESLQGTLFYISPEQTGRMNRPLDYRTDLYSLGITFYEMVTGTLPFQSHDPLEIVHAHIARTPEKVRERNPAVHPQVENIILKLLSKSSEDRYSSAGSLWEDLVKIKIALENRQKINFTLDDRKKNGAFYIPQRLYGREKQLEILEKYLEDAVKGLSRFLFVSGISGIGKSAVIGELQRPATALNAFFIRGKYDQFNRNFPYSGIIQAFTELISQLLSEEEKVVQLFRQMIMAQCEPNQQVLVSHIPVMGKIIGKHPSPPELSPAESQSRINDVFLCLIKVFAQKKHPMILFLDDMQWADPSSLNFLRRLATDMELKYFMFAGAFRNNETGAEHPLSFLINDLEKSGIPMQRIHVGALSPVEVADLVFDTLSDNSEKVRILSGIIHKKTGGNPFFIRQLMRNLYKEKILFYDREKRQWDYSPDTLENLEYSSNVIDLMIHRINQMDTESIRILKVASCIGDIFDLRTLSVIIQKPHIETYKMLWKTIEEGFIFSVEKKAEIADDEIQADILQENGIQLKYHFRFIHDRIRQAAYSMLGEKEKPIMHLKIGNLLLSSVKDYEEEIFQITTHLNKGIHLINDNFSRKRILAMNLRAGKKAIKASAYSSALEFFQAGSMSFYPELWQEDFELAFSLHLSILEAWYLNGEFKKAEEYFNILIENSRNNMDLIQVYNLKIILYSNQGEYEKSATASVEIINRFGYDISIKNLRSRIFKEYKKAKKNQGDYNADYFLNYKKMENPEKEKIMQIFINVTSSAFFWNPEFSTLISLLMINLTFEYGNTIGSDYAYCMYGTTLAGMGDFKVGYEFGKMSLDLNERYNDSRQRVKIVNAFYGWLNHWENNISTSLPNQQKGFQAAMNMGDLLFGGFLAAAIVMNYDSSGTNISNFYNDTFRYQKFANKIKYPDAELAILLLRQKAEVFKGNTYKMDSMDSDTFSEEIFLEMSMQSNNRLPLFLFYSIKSRLSYMNGQHMEALRISSKAYEISTSVAGMMQQVEHLYFHALILAEVAIQEKNHPDLDEFRMEIIRIIKKFTVWANECNDNFQHKLCLIRAEYYRMINDFKEASYFYDCAIESAIESGFIQHAALAAERAFYFYREQNLRRAGMGYLKEAYYWYRIWQAPGKSDDLKKRFPEFLDDAHLEKTSMDNSVSSSETISGFHLDYQTILKATRAISSKMEINDLLASLLQISVENAGAEKGVILLESNSRYRIEKIFSMADGMVSAKDEEYYESGEHASAGIISYILRSQEKVVLDDARAESRYSKDPYIKKNNTRSVLCVPIIHQDTITGILYLENNLASGVFTAERLEILDLVTAQAGISLTNAKLYAHKELEYAQRIQKSILPDNCMNPFFDIACVSRPAEAVGGDYYDYMQYGDRYFFFIGDVSGHGLSAGLLSMMVQTSLRTILQVNPNIEHRHLVENLDVVLTDNLKKMGIFKYMTYLLLSTTNGKTLEYSGLHNETIIYRKKTNSVEIFESRGKWLGISIDMETPPRQFLEMEIGDILLLYTDGITEAFNLEGNVYGMERLSEMLLANADLSSREIRDKILNDVESFMHYQRDDITMMVIKKK